MPPILKRSYLITFRWVLIGWTEVCLRCAGLINYGRSVRISTNKMVSKKKVKKRKKKCTALIICRSGKQFWTTQTQFWQWFREGTIIKVQDNPLTGNLVRENEETLVLLGHIILNLAHRNHLSEVLQAKRVASIRRKTRSLRT